MGKTTRRRISGPPPTKALPHGRERIAAAAIWLLVCASIVLLPDAFVRWFLPKDLLAAIAITLASLATARERLPRWFVLASAGAALLALVGVLLSAAPSAQFWGRWPRYEGLVTLPVYFGAVWAGARLIGPEGAPTRVRGVVRAAATAAIALGLVSAFEALGARPFSSDLARPGSLTGNATDQGVLGALFLAILLLPVLRAWTDGGAGSGLRTGAVERAWLTGGLALAGVSVILSASRAGLLAAGTVVTVLLALEVVRVGRGRARHVIALGASAAAVLAAGALAVPFTRDRVLGLSPLATQSLEGRFGYWRDALGLLAAHPLGVGASGFLNADAAASNGIDTLDSPHNWVLQVAMAGGYPLLLLVLGIVLAAAIVGLRAWRAAVRDRTDAARTDLQAAALAGLAGYGLALLTHFTAPSTTILAAALAGLLLVRAPEGGWRERLGTGAARARAAGIRSVVLAAWSVWLVVLVSAELPLAGGVAAAAHGDVAGADRAFSWAASLRPWDGDLSSIAAQSFAAAADAGLPAAAPLAVTWAERSLTRLPGTIATERALSVGQFRSGDTAGAVGTLGVVVAQAPTDVPAAVQHALLLYAFGDLAASAAETDRALSLDPAEPTALKLRALLQSR